MYLNDIIMSLHFTHPTLKQIKVQNFKSFKSAELNVGKFNVLIGANASGKSNFVQIFSFLHDIQQYGLDNAISLQGGIEFVRNFKVGSKDNLIFEMHLTFPHPTPLCYTNKKNSDVNISDLVYRFELQLGKQTSFKIIDDKAVFTCKYSPTNQLKDSHGGEIIFANNKGRIKISHTFEDSLGLKVKDFSAYHFREEEQISSKSLLLESPLFSYMVQPSISKFIKDISVYDFDSKLAKKATIPLKSKIELEHDGSNLAVVLKNTLKNKDNRRKFTNLIKDLLPFVNSVDIKKNADKSTLFNFKENYFKNQKLPSDLISDGTINITALIIALYFQKDHITILEDLEQNIHPSLISKVVEMIKDVSSSRQILVTTHSPEMVRYAGIENIYLVTRDREGFSNIVKPENNNDVKEFIKNEMEITELYVQNLLGA